MTASVPDGTATDGAVPGGDVNVPALLRGARGSYAHTITAFLAEAGCDDLPQNGPFVLGGMASHRASAVDMTRGLGVTRQAASQLIDTPAELAGLRAGLTALAQIRERTARDGRPKA